MTVLQDPPKFSEAQAFLYMCNVTLKQGRIHYCRHLKITLNRQCPASSWSLPVSLSIFCPTACERSVKAARQRWAQP